MTTLNSNLGVSELVILGGGLTGWTVAAGLARSLKPLPIKITLVNCEKATEVYPLCESVSPAFFDFHRQLGFNEIALMKEIQGGYKLATLYQEWRAGNTYYLPLSDHGFMMEGVEFQHYYIHQCLQKNNELFSFSDYSLGAIAAKYNRFRHPSSQQSSLFSTYIYGANIACEAYAEYMRKVAIMEGVVEVQGRFGAADVEVESKNITQLQVFDHQENQIIVQGDFYIDCSGDNRLLVHGTLKQPSKSLLDLLPVDRQISCQIESTSLHPVVSLSAQTYGWSRKIETPLIQERQIYFNSQIVTPNKTEYEGEVIKITPIDPHCNERVWIGNCLAIGGSAQKVGDFLVDRLHLIFSAVLRFVNLFPRVTSISTQSQEYNRLTQLEINHVIALHAYHYVMAGHPSSEFWLSLKKDNLPFELNHRLALFESTGILPFYEGDSFSSSLWASLFFAGGASPSSFDPLLQVQGADWVAQQLQKMKAMIASAAESMPTQKSYLQGIYSVK